jgi:uncharacterized protein involved in high-affinity Fe2+ transport
MRMTHALAFTVVLVAALAASRVAAEHTMDHPEISATPCPPASKASKPAAVETTSLTSTALISSSTPAAKVTDEPALIGRVRVDDMIIQLELQPAKPMWIAKDSPPKFSKQAVQEGEIFHVDAVPIDPRTNKRIPYATVKFTASNQDNGQTVKGELKPMWSRQGLHYAFNSGLQGDGFYKSKVTVGIPTLARHRQDVKRWMEPVTAKFHFRLQDGKLTEVFETAGH